MGYKKCSLCGRRFAASKRSEFCSMACEQMAHQYSNGLRLVNAERGETNQPVRKKKVKKERV